MLNTKIIPKKSLGQNFLVNCGVLGKIISATELSSSDTVLEIGPGTGMLTEALARKAGQVIAIEKDERLIPVLKSKFASYENVGIVEGDILKFDVRGYKLEAGSWKLVGNIPYYITSHLLKTIFESDGWRTVPPKLIILMVQYEVARRICDTKEGSILSLSVQYFAEPKIITRVSRGSFRPSPKVDSAILKLIPHHVSHNSQQTASFFKLVKAGFAHKRKILLSNLTEVFPKQKDVLLRAFDLLGINSSERAQNLKLAQWLKLVEMIDF